LVKLAFHGAAGTVTGSKYLLTVNDHGLLIDCGMFQGARELRQRNWQPLPFDQAMIDGVVITHAHIDHVGFLPRLVRDGYNRKVFTTAPTTDLAGISLLDSAHIQEEDAAYRTKKKLTRHGVALPLFTTENAEDTLKLMVPTPYDTWTSINDSIRFRLHIAGHILGAASVEVEVRDGSRKFNVLFSGDVGRYGNPLTANPTEPPQCDYLVCESTYGGRIHEPEDVYYVFEQLLNEVIDKKSILLIPAFAVGRTQQVSYLIHGLIENKRIPRIKIHIDSPMAVSVTDIYCKYHSYHSVDINKFGGRQCPLNGKHVKLHRKRKSSKLLNRLKGPAIIISASGMLSGGRIMHHLINRLPDPDTTLALVGFMANGTLGRKLAEGDRKVYIHKQPIEVEAKILSLRGLSGHADYYELLHWLEPVKKKPRMVFVTHGEESQSVAMADHIRDQYGWDCMIPTLNEAVEL